MKKLFAATQHYVVLALRNNGVTFPTTKDELLAKAGNELVRVDWEKSIPLKELCQGIQLKSYENKAQFFCALMGTITVFH